MQPQPAAATLPLSPRSGGLSFAILTATLVLLTALAAFFTSGNIAAVLAPALAFGFVWLLTRIPVRTTLLGLFFFGLTLECPQEIPAAGEYKTPLYRFGEILLSKANDWTFISPLVFTGVDVLVVFLIGLLIWRRATGSTMDTAGRGQTAGVMALAASVSFLGLVWIWGYGLARGGDFGNSLLQIYKLLYVPFLYFVWQAAMRGPADHPALAKVIIGAALYRSALAIYIRATVPGSHPGAELPYATTHGDSMLFASAAALVIALLNERVGSRRRGFRHMLIGCLIVILLGMVANHRRVAWVGLAAIVVTYYLIVGWTPLKKSVTRAVVYFLPILAIYMAAGWGSAETDGGLFAPVRITRSVIDSKSDASTMWRDLENMDLILTIQDNALLGTGLGHGYEEQIKLPDVSKSFKLYRFIPHNSLLGFLVFAGVVGFTLIWAVLTVGIFLGARSYRFARDPLDRAIALWAIATFVGYFNSVYADMGQGSWTAVFTVCPALGAVSKLAVSCGAWPRRRAKSPAAPA